MRVWTELSWLCQGLVLGSYEHGNELLGSIKGREFLDKLSDSQLLKDFAAWCHL